MFDVIIKRHWECHKEWTFTPEPVYRVTCYLRIFSPVSQDGEKILFEADAWHLGASAYAEEVNMKDIISVVNRKVNSRIKVQVPEGSDIYYKNTRSGEMYKEQKLPLRYRSTEIHANNC